MTAQHKARRSRLISIDNFNLKNAGYLLDPFYLSTNLPAVNE
jgi:hypothetical protein